MNEFFERFPEMQPITSPPGLSTINGFGTTAYGARDHDPDTGTYVKTVWFVALFIPVFPLGAYRVADAPSGGWYFLGKVPVSGQAKGWALCLVLLILSAIGYGMWVNHIESPSYKAGQRLAEADRLRQQGKPADAAKIYQSVAQGPTDQKPRALSALQDLLNALDLDARTDPAQATGVLRVAWDMRDQLGGAKTVFERGLALVEAMREDHPADSLKVLEVVEPAAEKPEAYLPLKQKVLEQIVAQQPGNPEPVSQLAVVYEQTKQLDRCQALLEPLADKLGSTEGARILGMIWFDKGKQEQAYTLLQRYADERLKALHDAEQKYQQAYDAAENAVISSLRNGTAVGFDFVTAEASPEARRREMVQQYVARQLKSNVNLTRLEETFRRELKVVPVAMDLGIIQLGRAQKMTNPAERKAELERAEKTFLAIRGVAGEQEGFKLSLGQVYYWLGRQAEGRKLFAEVLKAKNRSVEMLVAVGRLQRQLGAMEEARTLLEEAYNKPAIDQKLKQGAALLRALTSKDLDDQITWLERSNPTQPMTRASLAEARGQKALEEGKDEEAARRFREAVEIYAALPESASTLNNGGLALLSVFRASGDRPALEKGVQMLKKAAELEPKDGILVSNVAEVVLRAGIANTVRDRIDLGKLRRQGDLGLLSFLYADQPGRQDLGRKLAEDPHVQKARTLLDRALLLAPSNASGYAQVMGLLYFLDDRAGLQRLKEKAEQAKLDLAAEQQQTQEFWEGKNLEKSRKEANDAVTRTERMVETTRPVGGATFAVAVQGLVHARERQDTLGMDVDADALVRLAEEAHRMAPSTGSSGVLRSALMLRASKSLAAQVPEYRELLQKGKRHAGNVVPDWRGPVARGPGAVRGTDQRRRETGPGNGPGGLQAVPRGVEFLVVGDAPAGPARRRGPACRAPEEQ